MSNTKSAVRNANRQLKFDLVTGKDNVNRYLKKIEKPIKELNWLLIRYFDTNVESEKKKYADKINRWKSSHNNISRSDYPKDVKNMLERYEKRIKVM